MKGRRGGLGALNRGKGLQVRVTMKDGVEESERVLDLQWSSLNSAFK